MFRLAGMSWGLVMSGLVLSALVGCAASDSPTPTPTPTTSPSVSSPSASPPSPELVVVYTATAEFRHESIDAGRNAIVQIAQSTGGFEVLATEDNAVLRDALPDAGALVLLNTTGDVFDAPTEDAIRAFVEGGGGLVGVHSATDTEHDWDWFRAAIGAEFLVHPAVQEAVVDVVAAHPSTAALPESRLFRDEWYNVTAPLPDDFLVLATVDESTYQPGDAAMGLHPVVWCRSGPGDGTVWYTALGHEVSTYADPGFLSMLEGGILSVLDRTCAKPFGGGS